MRDRQGRLRYLLRMPGRKGVTIKGDLGSEEFARNYHLALTGFEPVEPKGLGIPRQGTVAALVRTYLASAAFTNLASETSRHRRNLVEEFAEAHGDKPVAALLAKHVRALVANKGNTPGQARSFLTAVSALMSFAVDVGMREDNPCRGIKRPKLSKEGWHGWTDEQIEVYRAYHPYGSMARLTLELALSSLQRRSDLVQLGRQHLKDGLITVAKQQKTGNPAYAAVSIELQQALDAMPARTGATASILTFLLTSHGQPFMPDGLSTRVRLWCLEAGLDNCPLHGLRKAGARIAVNSGCDITEVAAMGGWKTVRELQRYIEDFNRQQAAVRAGAKIRTATLARTRSAQNSHTEKKA
jgi:site-specific recombinase XerD